MPVILSFENHCCRAQQKVMAEILVHIFRNNGMLLEPDPSNKLEKLPSPEELKNKIIIKGKRGNLLTEGEGGSSADLDEDEEDDESDIASRKSSLSHLPTDASMSSIGTSQAKKKKPKKSTHPDLAAITYLGAAHAPKNFSPVVSNSIPCDIMSSYSETKTLKHLSKPASVERWIQHNAVHMRLFSRFVDLSLNVHHLYNVI